MALKVGDTAPEFSLADADRNMRSLSEFVAKKTVLAFIPGAFTGVCTKELCEFESSLTTLNNLGAQVVAIDVDSPFVNRAFADHNKLTLPILSDHTREITKSYCGVHEDFAGIKGYSAPKRAVFVLDRQARVQYAWISENPGAEPPYQEVEKALAAFD